MYHGTMPETESLSKEENVRGVSWVDPANPADLTGQRARGVLSRLRATT
jgi:hypothetical protein